MVVLDSSGWLEYLWEGGLADRFVPYLEDMTQIVTPAIVLSEVYRAACRAGSDREAMSVVAQLEQTTISPLGSDAAITAAELSRDHGLALADALIYAAARLEGCGLVTADTDFRGLPGVVLIEATAEAEE